MRDVLEALLDLNKALMLEGFKSDFTITLSKSDFKRFAVEFEKQNKYLMHYPELDYGETFDDLDHIKIAGPGNYFHIKREQ